jgi:hypothetical protein
LLLFSPEPFCFLLSIQNYTFAYGSLYEENIWTEERSFITSPGVSFLISLCPAPIFPTISRHYSESVAVFPPPRSMEVDCFVLSGGQVLPGNVVFRVTPSPVSSETYDLYPDVRCRQTRSSCITLVQIPYTPVSSS